MYYMYFSIKLKLKKKDISAEILYNIARLNF